MSEATGGTEATGGSGATGGTEATDATSPITSPAPASPPPATGGTEATDATEAPGATHATGPITNPVSSSPLPALVTSLITFYTNVAPTKYPPGTLPYKCSEIIERYTNKDQTVDVMRLRADLRSVYPNASDDIDGVRDDTGPIPSTPSPLNNFAASYKQSSAASNSNIEAYALSALSSLKSKARTAANNLATNTNTTTTVSETLTLQDVTAQLTDWSAPPDVIADLTSLINQTPLPSDPTRDYKAAYTTLLDLYHRNNPIYTSPSPTTVRAVAHLPLARAADQRKIVRLEKENARLATEREEIESAIVTFMNLPAEEVGAAEVALAERPAASPPTPSTPSLLLQTSIIASLQQNLAALTATVDSQQTQIQTLEKFKSSYQDMKADNTVLKKQLKQQENLCGEFKTKIAATLLQVAAGTRANGELQSSVDSLKHSIASGVSIRDRMEARLAAKEEILIDSVDKLRGDAVRKIEVAAAEVWEGVQQTLGGVDALAVKDMEMERIEMECFEVTRELGKWREKGRADEKSIRTLKDEIKRAAERIVEMTVECEKRGVENINFKSS